MDKLGRHSALYFIGRILSGVFFLLAVILFLRLGGEEEYGSFTLVYTTVLLIFALSSGWVTQGILRFGPEVSEKPRQHVFLKTVKAGSIISCFLGVPILLICVARFNFAGPTVIFVSGGLYILLFWISVRNTLLQAELNPLGSALFDTTRVLLFLLGPIAVYLVGGGAFDFTTMLLGIVAGYFVLFLLAQVTPAFRSGFQFQPEGERDDLFRSTFLKFGIPMGCWLGLAYLVNVLDRYLIASFSDLSDVGVYSAVYDLVFRAFSLVYLPILNAAHPLIMNYGLEDREASLGVMKRAFLYVGLLFPVLLALLWFTGPLLAGLLDLPFDEIRPLLLPLGIGVFFWNVAVLAHKPLELHQKTWPMIAWMMIALAVNAVGNIVLIPLYGYVAAAYTTILSVMVYLAGISFKSWTYMGRDDGV